MSFCSALPRTLILFDERRRTRDDYAFLPTREIFRLIDVNQVKQDNFDSDEDWEEATFALRELYAVLATRRRE